MKLDNLMKSWENDEIWENVGKMQFASRSFFSRFFCTREFFPKVVLWFWGDLFWQAKATEELLGKTRMKMIWTSNQIKRKLWNKQLYKLPNINTQYCTIPFCFLLLNAFESTTSLNKASNANASRGGGIIMKRTYFYFHRRAKALKEDFIIQIDCI